MATKRLFDKRSQKRQDAPRTGTLHLYYQRIATSALVGRAELRKAAIVHRSDTDWCAFSPATSPHAPKMAGLAKGLDSAVVFKPITDSARLIEAASRIGRAA